MEKIKQFKKILKKVGFDGYIVPKNDEFFCEYIENYNDRLKYISNFSGSYGIALILKNKNYLFVDGRYTLQAGKECKNLFSVKTIPGKMPNKILKKKKFRIGYDPKLFTKKTFNIFFNKTNCKFLPINENLIDRMWVRKKLKSNSKFYVLPNNITGQSSNSKINKMLKILKRKGADFQFITASENNAWLLNIRGKDSDYTPLPKSYLLLDKNNKIYFFCDLKKITSSFRRKFKNIKFEGLNKISFILSKIKNKKFIIDQNTCSIFFEKLILENNKIVENKDPIYFLKSIKTKKEINNIKRAHVYDGAALTKYLFWIKNNYFKKRITELSGEKKLLKLRKINKSFKFLSFPTISSTGSNGAIIHYKATKKTDKLLKKGHLYLVDSGGQYNFGTTDVTRTISLDNKNKRIKNIFTRVLKGHIAVTSYNLNKNSTGSLIDEEARKYLKEINLNYPHGTGHGVGYYLNVHEGPQSISKNNKIILKEGMILSNEPGYYEKDKFGIRIENLIYIKKKKNKFSFNNLTMSPIDKSLIDYSLLTFKERKWLNDYHKIVFKNLSKFMNKNEFLELKNACSSV